MNMSFSDLVAAVAAGIAVLALFVGLYATFVSRQVATSDFRAAEEVKLDTARLIAVLRSLMVKGTLYTQQDKGRRDDPAFESFVDIQPERVAIQEFLHSPTALAYYSFVAKKSEQAREAGVQGEAWRVFFLELGQLHLERNPWVAAKQAAKLERQFDRVGEAELREIAGHLGDLPKAIEVLFSAREHDPLTYVLVERNAGSGPITQENFIDFVRFLREDKQIEDPELDVFWAASSGDVELLKAAQAKGANLNITSGALIHRYKDLVPEFEQSAAGGGG